MIDINSLEIFKQNRYFKTNIGMVSDNAYLSIIVTNKCQCKCRYCINGDTDMSTDLPLDKAIHNIIKLVEKYNIKEAIILGGEPTLYKDLFEFVKRLRVESGLEMIRITTNGIKLKDNPKFIEELIHPKFGVQGINISYHNEDFMSLSDLKNIYNNIKKYNSDIKIRVNSNIWKGNLDNIIDINNHLENISFVDEVRISNIIAKDSFSVNTTNKGSDLVLHDDKYISLFNQVIDRYSPLYTIIENKDTLGFVRYVLVPTKCPIIINWNLDSRVSKQVCENDIDNRQINTFKCLINGNISLSWNTNNIILL